MTTLALELSASRLLGSVFGASNIVWANVIGLILLYLTVGYFLGGRFADRSPHFTTFYQVLCWAAFAAGLVPLAARPVLNAAANAVLNINAPVLLGSFGVVLLLFAAPVILLGTVSPFAIRLALQDLDSAGHIAGRMYAISTLGSMLGTFTPVLLLIPAVGTARTFLIFAGLLLTIGLVGLARHDWRRALMLLWMPLALAVLAAIALRGTLKPVPPGGSLLFETESAYNYIQVVKFENTTYLFLNEGQGLHSIYNPDNLYTGGTWDYYLAAPFFNEPPYRPANVTSLAMIGLAGGTVTKQYAAVFGPIRMDGMEIDPAIAQAGRDYFDMNEATLNVIIQDGRVALNASDTTYDVIGVDAYRLPYIPWHMTTVEFFQEIRDHLRDDGVLAINVGRTATDRRLVDALGGTMSAVFPSVHVIDVPQTCNSIMVATVQPTTPQNLVDNLALMDESVHLLLRFSVQSAYDNIVEASFDDVVFTDDRAPTEQMTDLLLINFLLSGSTEIPCF